MPIKDFSKKCQLKMNGRFVEIAQYIPSCKVKSRVCAIQKITRDFVLVAASMFFEVGKKASMTSAHTFFSSLFSDKFVVSYSKVYTELEGEIWRTCSLHKLSYD